MQIIFGDSVNLVKDRFTVLELDSFSTESLSAPITAWCVVHTIPLQEIGLTENLVKIHQDLIAQFRQKNWAFCLECIGHLRGRWNGELDSFYNDLETRVKEFISLPPEIDAEFWVRRHEV